jgi:hypothetical protein
MTDSEALDGGECVVRHTPKIERRGRGRRGEEGKKIYLLFSPSPLLK